MSGVHGRRHDGAARLGLAVFVLGFVAAVFLAAADHVMHPLASGVSALAALGCLLCALGCVIYLNGGRR